MTTPAQIPSETDPVAAAPAVSAPPAGKPLPAWKERLKGLIAESGAIVLWVYFGIFFTVWVGFAMAIKAGVNVQGAAGAAGTWGAAYLATKLTQPLRIAATLFITPALAGLLRRFRRKRASLPPPPPSQQA